MLAQYNVTIVLQILNKGGLVKYGRMIRLRAFKEKAACLLTAFRNPTFKTVATTPGEKKIRLGRFIRKTQETKMAD